MIQILLAFALVCATSANYNGNYNAFYSPNNNYYTPSSAYTRPLSAHEAPQVKQQPQQQPRLAPVMPQAPIQQQQPQQPQQQQQRAIAHPVPQSPASASYQSASEYSNSYAPAPMPTTTPFVPPPPPATTTPFIPQQPLPTPAPSSEYSSYSAPIVVTQQPPVQTTTPFVPAQPTPSSSEYTSYDAAPVQFAPQQQQQQQFMPQQQQQQQFAPQQQKQQFAPQQQQQFIPQQQQQQQFAQPQYGMQQQFGQQPLGVQQQQQTAQPKISITFPGLKRPAPEAPKSIAPAQFPFGSRLRQDAPTPVSPIPDNFCDGRPIEERLPHPTETTQFVVCHESTPADILSCPNGLVFNLNTLNCENSFQAPKACSSSPCQNRAACVDLPFFQFRCECASGFTGELCEKRAVCEANSCGAQGVCIQLAEGGPVNHYCICEQGMSYGLNCASNFEQNPCLSSPAASQQQQQQSTDGALFASKSNPAIYVQCEGFMPHMRFCNYPLVFSAAVGQCDWIVDTGSASSSAPLLAPAPASTRASSNPAPYAY